MNTRIASRLVLACAIGLAAGVVSYTFVYAKGYSYMSNDPAACANCHIMNDQYSGWIKSSHRSVATCNDCHTPHDLVGKYATKARNGFWHSWYFTMGGFPEPIQITPRSLEVTEEACRNCHQNITQAIEGPHGETDRLSCTKCHRNVGHLH